jgi:hypothetical protein
VGVIFLQAIMETILAFFNHFPLFAIMLRLKDPHRLPGGLDFEVFSHNNFLLEHHGIFHRIKQIWSKLTSKKQEKVHHLTSKKSSTKKTFKKRSISFSLPGLPKKKAPTQSIDASRGAYLWMRVKYIITKALKMRC